MNRIKLAALPFILVAFGGCTVARQTPFNEADFTYSARSGSGVITGRVQGFDADHSPVYGKRSDVCVQPVNAYTTENIQRQILKGVKLRDADPRENKYLHTATTDDDGNFTVRGIPPGEYYVVSEANWRTSYPDTNTDGNPTITYRDYWKLFYTRVSMGAGQSIHVTSWNQESPVQTTMFAHSYETGN